MLAKVINYTDYNGEDRSETFYFNLSKAELAELNLTTEGGLQATIQKIVDAKNVPELTRWFKKIIGMAYGEKSSDGRRFIKSPEMTEEFFQTEAYGELFFELLTNEEAAANFINAVIPKLDKPAIPAPPVK